MVLNRKLVVLLGVTQEEISKINTGIGVVEGEPPLSCAKKILDLLVERPAATDLELMRSLGPRDVIANLVVVRFVVPGPTSSGVFSAGTATQDKLPESG